MSDNDFSTLQCMDCGSVYESSIVDESLASEAISLVECPLCLDEVIE